MVIIGKSLLLGIILKKYKLVKVILRLFAIIAKNTYPTDNKGHDATNLLAHVPNCLKNPNRDAHKGKKYFSV